MIPSAIPQSYLERAIWFFNAPRFKVCVSEEATSTIFITFGMVRPGIDLLTSRITGEHPTTKWRRFSLPHAP